MAKWRAEAIRRLPELRLKVAAAENLMALWIDLRFAFERAYEAKPPDESLIARIYSFADWCMDAPRNDDAGRDPFTAAALCFYEHIPDFAPARDDMPRWFSYTSSRITSGTTSSSRWSNTWRTTGTASCRATAIRPPQCDP